MKHEIYVTGRDLPTPIVVVQKLVKRLRETVVETRTKLDGVDRWATDIETDLIEKISMMADDLETLVK